MKKFLTGSVLVLSFVLIGAVTGASQAHAATLTGWAWSETFGWFSFNSADNGAAGGPYAVSVNSSGTWSGYAWSDHVGWMSFNSADLAACGSAGHLDTATGAVTGWARILSFGGADGCVKLSGTNHLSPSPGGSGGVTYDSNSGVFKGYAWGGDLDFRTGVGWLQFNPEISNPVKCLSADCGYGGTIEGTCTRSPADSYFTSPTNVTFTASGNSGNTPYHYAWNGAAYDTLTPTNQFTITYASTPSTRPTVIVKDANNLVSEPILCPLVTIINPIGSSNLQIGRTAASANSTQVTIKQTNPFALAWNFTMTEDYSCSATINPDPNNASWNSSWKGLSLGVVDNDDGTKTWSGNTGTNLKAGTVAVPVTPGIYQFGIYCTSSADPTPGAPQGVTATLKVDSSQVKEI